PPGGEYPMFKDQVHPEDRERFILSRKQAIDTLEPNSQEYRVVRTDGQVVWVLARSQMLVNESDKAARLLVAMIDITERKHAEAALRESEARFRSLTHLSSDWYWEQDEQFGLTFMSGRMGERTGLDASAYLGRKRWDQPALNLTDADWAAHRAALERHEPFRDFEMHRQGPGGSTRWLSISGEPLFDVEGRLRGYRGIGRDITERKRAAQLLALEHSVARRFAASADAGQALREALRAICESEGWECGRFLRVDAAAGVLRYSEAWSIGDAEIERYLEVLRDKVYAPGVGLAGTVWQSQQPLWAPDITKDPRVATPGIARDTGMRASLSVPVGAEGRPVGVFIFHSRRVRAPDERLLQSIRVIGAQVGQFMQRAQAEQALRESEARFRSLVQLSSDFYWETDAEHRLTQTTHDQKYRPASQPVIGKRRWDLPSIVPDAAGWAAHRATVEARQPFRDFEIARVDPDGVRRHLLISGELVLGARGEFVGYRGLGRDITQRRREERLVALEHAVARYLADAKDVSDALRAVMRAVCE